MKTLVLLGDRNPNVVTHRELDATLTRLPEGIHANWIATDAPDATKRAAEADALWVVSGSPYRNDAVVCASIRNARISGQPFLGTCAGFQYAVVEFARNAAGIENASHAETAAGAGDPVVDRLTCSLIGEEREVTAVEGTRLYEITGAGPFTAFHWCNYGLAPAWADRLTQHGLVISARAEDAGVEAIELPGHPFFLATLFQPQIGALAGRPLSPIIEALLAAAD